MLRHAFLNQYNMIVLGGTVAFSWAIRSVVPMEIGAGVEVIWLVIWVVMGARSPFFRRWVEEQEQHRERRREEERWGRDVTETDDAFDPERATWLRRLRSDIVELDRQVDERRGGPPSRFPDPKLKELWQALARLAAVQERMVALADEDHVTAVQQEMERLHRDVADEKDVEVRISLRHALSLGRRCLQTLQQVATMRGLLNTKVSTLEMSLEQLRADLVEGSSEEELSLALDGLLATARLTRELEVEREAIGTLSRLGLVTLSDAGVGAR